MNHVEIKIPDNILVLEVADRKAWLGLKIWEIVWLLDAKLTPDSSKAVFDNIKKQVLASTIPQDPVVEIDIFVHETTVHLTLK